MRPFVLVIFLLIHQQVQGQKLTPVASIKTPLGTIYVEFHPETTQHQASFIQLAEAGYWDSLTFNRVIPEFVAQGGCPDTEEGFTDPEYLLEPEIFPHLQHIYGAVGAGRDDNPEKLSARCQFYIVHRKEGVHRLDGDYTVFGQVIQGMDVVDALVHTPRNAQNQPLEDMYLEISILRLSGDQLSDLKNRL
ncbi:peptidylprolyl isomerase [Mongoliitalea daihaiensis]|uniref:peptidylprolyl isomerase n=1 Tax=Mongoliitalea daihaiensis TaxID=2782006 RepID=UPI001F366098|nr:peptidylprolyl isomerase [Mongoliitalea daihaiensis]UJP64506.1 peptidylprolyl isomerase [Mongoliitalea daihaiensis]